MISLDTETTGLDLHHGAKPFFISTASEDDSQTFWEFDVDPLTRQPIYSESAIQEVRDFLGENNLIVFHNAKFDYQALKALDPRLVEGWDWGKVRDTALADHLLNSIYEHGLEKCADRWLELNIKPLEDSLAKAVKECRQLCHAKVKGAAYKEWAVAKEGRADMPSVRDEIWRADYWLPRAIARHQQLHEPEPSCDHKTGPDNLCLKCRGHYYWYVLKQYSLKDAAVTLGLWVVMEEAFKTRYPYDLTPEYLDRLKIIPINVSIEDKGVPCSKANFDYLYQEFTVERDKAENICHTVAAIHDYPLEIPKSSRNASMDKFVFEVLKVPVVKKTETGKPALDKYVLEDLAERLPTNSQAGIFIRSLKRKRSRDTALSFIEAYRRFGVDIKGYDGYFTLHPHMNPVKSKTTRWTCENPNEQNISKKGVDVPCPACGGKGGDCKRCYDKDEKMSTGWVPMNLRYGISPPPGFELWSMDGQNLELRIPSYGAQEKEMIALFEEPNKPPYFGSNHLLNFHTVYPDVWDKVLKEVGLEKVGKECKNRFKDSWYQWVKNGGFAVLYGAIDRPGGGGTADLAFHKRGAHALLKSRFTRLEAYNQKWIRFAEVNGYVETMPRKHVNPHHGYPLMCTRTQWNNVLPTVPLNYHVQGTACLWMQDAMILCHDQLEEWNRESRGKWLGYIALQVHDELVFCMTKRAHPKEDPKRSNLGRIRVLQKLMEQGGVNIGVPTPTSCEYHENNWAEGIAL